MAAREVLRKWQGRQEAPDETAMRKALRDAFSHEDVGLRSEYIDGKTFTNIANFIPFENLKFPLYHTMVHFNFS